MLKQLISRFTRGGGAGRPRRSTPGPAGGRGRSGGGTEEAVGRGAKKLFRRLR